MSITLFAMKRMKKKNHSWMNNQKAGVLRCMLMKLIPRESGIIMSDSIAKCCTHFSILFYAWQQLSIVFPFFFTFLRFDGNFDYRIHKLVTPVACFCVNFLEYPQLSLLLYLCTHFNTLSRYEKLHMHEWMSLCKIVCVHIVSYPYEWHQITFFPLRSSYALSSPCNAPCVIYFHSKTGTILEPW